MTRDEFVRRASLAGVIVSTAVLSYSVLQLRAEHIGFPFWSSLLYPIGLDALILGASRTWQDAKLTRGTRRLAMWMTLGAIGAGIAAFIVEFRALGWEAVAFAVLIPASLAAALVLTSRAAADRLANDAAKERSATHDDAEARFETVLADAMSEPSPDGASYPRQSVTFAAPLTTFTPGPAMDLGPVYDDMTPPSSDADQPAIDAGASSVKAEPVGVETRRAWVREQLEAGVNITGADVDRKFHGARNGARLLRQVRDQIAREHGMK